MTRVIETARAASFVETLPRVSLGLDGDGRDGVDAVRGTGSGGSSDPRFVSCATTV